MNAKIFLLIIASILLAGSAAAIEVCCEKLANSDDYCVYTDEESCDPKLKDAAINCEQTSFCQPGCCYSSDEGECYKNVARSECSSVEGSAWTDSANCGISQCQKGCCILGSQGFFVTEVRCKLETSQYGNVTMQWKPEITTEPECQAQARSQDMGCCVTADKCAFTIREQCATAATAPTAENETREGFYKDMLCSNDMLSCGCAKQTTTACYDDKVYWVDSCGNRENIYSADKTKSYNNGYALDPDSICSSPAIQDPRCGNCDYALGSVCRTANKIKPTYGEQICSTTKCSTTYNDGVSPSAGTAKKNGESWCLYDSAVGKAQDPVGSRHYRRMCVNGEEMTEPCMDYREELCIQGVLGEAPTETFEAFRATGDYVEATCRDNRWEDCFKCNEVASGCGGECTDATCCRKKCCENEALRDCYFLQAGDLGYCVPQVPPGLQFWPAGTAELPTSTTRSTPATTAAVTTGAQQGAHGSSGPNSNAESVCSQANQECTAVWKIGGTGKIGIGGITTQTDYECMANCHCTKPEWVIGGNTLCKSLGDCGAYFNYLGRITLDGYANTASEEKKEDKNLYFNGYKLKEKDVGNWKTLAAKGEAISGKDGGFGEIFSGDFFGNFGAPILVFAASGIYAKVMTNQFLPGVTGGLSILAETPMFLKGWDTGVTSMEKEAQRIYGEPWKISETKTALTANQNIPKNVFIPKENTLEILKTNKDLGQAYEKAFTNTMNIEGKGAADAIQAGNKAMMDEAVKKGLAEKAPDGGIKIIDSKAFTTPADGSYSMIETRSANVMGTINTIMWIYTIYKLIDVIFAETKEQTYSISCAPWVAPEKGADCEKCNDNPEKPCSIYRCKSLGQNCYLVNQGTKDEKCVNLNPNDVNSPIIEPWKEVLPTGYTLTPTTFEGNKGYKINEKIGPYSLITLGIKTDEPSQCKFTDKIGTDFDQIATFFGDSQYVYEHQTTFVIPAEFMTKDALRKTGDTYTLYARCKDASGNKNERDYFIRFTLKAEPDMTAPVIEQTSIAKGAYISYEAKQTGFSVFVNERAECKYDTFDKEYDLMSKKFECPTSAFTVNSALYGMFECKTSLELTNTTSYTWYIRCKDTAGNTNKESYVFNILPTKPLSITSTGPTGTFYENKVTLKATTAEGAEDGKATCAYSNEDEPYTNMVVFLTTGSTLHEQELAPGTGDFTYYIKCIDVAGNMASANTTFKIEVDTAGPKILYIYVTSSNYLHLEMDEASTCEYSNSTFSYGTGSPMTGAGTAVHELAIAEKTYHITCQDVYANEAKFVVYP